jgi:transposase-like protein
MRYYHYNSPYSASEKLRALKMWEKHSTIFVCHRFHCSSRSLRRWRKQYDGTLDSLENQPKGPRSPMPNSQTNKEKSLIRRVVKKNPHMGLVELYGLLRDNYGYNRHPATLSRYLKTLITKEDEKKKETYVPKPYNKRVIIFGPTRKLKTKSSFIII